MMTPFISLRSDNLLKKHPPKADDEYKVIENLSMLNVWNNLTGKRLSERGFRQSGLSAKSTST